MNLLLRFFAVSALLTAAQTYAADAFEGKVNLVMTGEKGKPTNMNYSIKGAKIRTEMETEKGAMSTIMDTQKMEITMLMPAEKTYMVMPIKKTMEKAAEKQKGEDPDIQRTGKTEKILGYVAEQVIVTDKQKGTTTELWIAPDLGTFMGLGNGGGGPFGGRSAASAKWEEVLKGKSGFPLRVITTSAKGKESFKLEATKVEPGPLPDSVFLPPSDYQKFDMPDLGGLNPFKRG